MSEPRHLSYGDDAVCPAPPGLSDFVLYLWRRRFPPDVPLVNQPTLPDGCIDLVTIDGGPCYVMGPETVRMDHAIAGGTEILGVRLRPGVGARLFGAAAPELTDGGAFLGDLPGGAAVPGRTGDLLDHGCPDHRPLLEALLPLVATARPDDGVAFGTDWMARHPAATMDDLCARLGWSGREVRRRFTRALGFGPKVMQRMLRFQRALSLAERAGAGPLAGLGRLAAAAGYADQPHMTREFRALARTTPATLVGGPFDATLAPLLDRT